MYRLASNLFNHLKLSTIMENKNQLLLLGEEVIEKESVYLKLRIEKALSDKGSFNKDEELMSASNEREQAMNRYHSFLANLQNYRASA